MKSLLQWLMYILAAAYIIAITAAGIGLFVGVIYKVFQWVTL